ncbi:MAG: hypothetical protein DDT32_01154 [Syntrophomonadaceae bacterium]|nr:hypothetical protein [Bacillota bacterium]
MVYLAAASYWDLKERRIPNKLIIIGLAIGLVLYALGRSAPDAIVAFLFIFTVMFIAYSINASAIGGGDVKLAAVIALFLGLYSGLFSLLVGFGLCTLYGGLIALARKGTIKTKYPLAPFMFVGVTATVIISVFTG